MFDRGVIVGCDANQEWILTWWWDHYRRHNAFPVAFADFGMSEMAKSWCSERGMVLDISSSITFKDVPPDSKERWENLCGKEVWFYRSAWFKKPFALLQCPFEIGIWIDLDCEINVALDPLFNVLGLGVDIALVREPEFVQNYGREKGFLFPGEVDYNAGVIVFRRNAAILHQWTLEAAEKNDKHLSDQSALCRVIWKNSHSLIELPLGYNCSLEFFPQALICHFKGKLGKREILKQMSHEFSPITRSHV